MKWSFVLVLLLFVLSCTSTYRITQANFDTNKQVYTISIEDMYYKGYLRDSQNRLIRNEADKVDFISNYNNYWLLDKKSRTNEFYNQYRTNAVKIEMPYYKSLNNNYDQAVIYFNGIKSIKSTNFQEALSHFDRLLNLYPDIQYFSDIYFLKAYCFERMTNKNMALSNYRLFIDRSVQRYSKYFAEDDDNTDTYLRELRYAYCAFSNTNCAFPSDILTNDIAKIHNDDFSPGFNYSSSDKLALLSFGLGYYSDEGFMIGASFMKSLSKNIIIEPTVVLSEYRVSLTLSVPIQIYRSVDHKFGFEITPVGYYAYHFYAELPNNSASGTYTTCAISQHVYNFGVEASAGYYILPSLYAGLSGRYMFYNQFNKYTLDDTVNGIDYRCTYWHDMYYYACVRYYFLHGLGIEAGVKNSDFLAGIIFNGMYLGYNINKNIIILNYLNMF